MRQKLASEREELLRERSRCAVAALEAKAQDEAWAARKAAADEEARQGTKLYLVFKANMLRGSQLFVAYIIFACAYGYQKRASEASEAFGIGLQREDKSCCLFLIGS